MIPLTEWFLSSSVLILMVLLLRAVLGKKLSLRIRYALWAVVLIRLLLPFSPLTSAMSLSSFAQPLQVQAEEKMLYAIPTQTYENQYQYDTPHYSRTEHSQYINIGGTTYEFANYLSGGFVSYQGQRTDYFFLMPADELLTLIWKAGIFLCAIWMMHRNLQLSAALRQRRTPYSVENCPVPVYLVSEGLPAPCLFGLFQPAVYLTKESIEDEAALRHVLAHELTHYAHKDHIWSFLRCVCLALHWYNPLVWAAAILSQRDGELACDEGAVARLGEEERLSYGRTLVGMVARRSQRPGDLLTCSTAMAEGKKPTQQRIQLLVKQPKTAVGALFLAACIIALIIPFAFSRSYNSNTLYAPSYEQFLSKFTADHEWHFQGLTVTRDILPEQYAERDRLLSQGIAANTWVDQSNYGSFVLYDDEFHTLCCSFLHYESNSKVWLYEMEDGCHLVAEHTYNPDDLFSRLSSFPVRGKYFHLATLPSGTVQKLRELVAPEKNTIGQYASINSLLQSIESTVRNQPAIYNTHNGSSTANVSDFKFSNITKEGELEGLSSEGTLEAWCISYMIQLDRTQGLILVGGQTSDEEGWLDLLGQGGELFILLRYPDESYDVLERSPINDGMDFFGHHESCEESLYDWYVQKNHLEDQLPLCVSHFEVNQNGETVTIPTHRYDGDGWYLYIPVSGWTRTQNQSKWSSAYFTGATLIVQPCDGSLNYVKNYYGSIGAWPYTTDMAAPFDSYYRLSPHSTETQTQIFFVPESEKTCYTITCAWPIAEVRSEEPSILHAMASSFRTDERFAAPSQEAGATAAQVYAQLAAQLTEAILDAPEWNDSFHQEGQLDPDAWNAWLLDTAAQQGYFLSHYPDTETWKFWPGGTSEFLTLEGYQLSYESIMNQSASPVGLNLNNFSHDPVETAADFGDLLAHHYLNLDPRHPMAVTSARLISSEVLDRSASQVCASISLAIAPVAPHSVFWMSGAGIDLFEEGPYAGEWRFTLDYRLELQPDGSWLCTESATGGLSAS